MAVFNGPPRAGSRGGRDQFNWENVRTDKDREYYLGHSVKALTGRWQKGKDVYWYTKDKKDADAAADDEFKAVKAQEQELMAEALGIKRTGSSGKKAALSRDEMHRLLNPDKQQDEDDESNREEAAHGFGFNRQNPMGVQRATVERLEGQGLDEPPGGLRGPSGFSQEGGARAPSEEHPDGDAEANGGRLFRSEEGGSGARKRRRDAEGGRDRHKRTRSDREHHKSRKEHKSHKEHKEHKSRKEHKHKQHKEDRYRD